MNRWELEKKVVMKAIKDPAFKKELLSNPKEALKSFCTEKQLEHVTVKVHQEKKNNPTVLLPYIDEKISKLSESELEKLFAAGDKHSGCPVTVFSF